MSTTKTSLIVREIMARLTGEDNKALAAKIARKSLSAIEGQLAALKAKQVDDENTVEDAQDALNNAQFPDTVFEKSQSYVEAIVKAQATYDAAKEKLDSTEESIAYFTKLLARLKEEK